MLSFNMSKSRKICHGETQGIHVRCSNSMELLIPQQSDLKSHQTRIPMISNCPKAQVLQMKGRLTEPTVLLQGV